jgi:predicted nucleic acid-binding protein
MTYVVDATLLLDHLRANPGATRAFDDALASGRRLTASVLTRIELRRGLDEHARPAVEAVDLLLDWIAVDHEIANTAADLALRHGDAIPAVDLVVAATAQRLGADLLTRDPTRYPMFPALRAPY